MSSRANLAMAAVGGVFILAGAVVTTVLLVRPRPPTAPAVVLAAQPAPQSPPPPTPLATPAPAAMSEQERFRVQFAEILSAHLQERIAGAAAQAVGPDHVVLQLSGSPCTLADIDSAMQQADNLLRNGFTRLQCRDTSTGQVLERAVAVAPRQPTDAEIARHIASLQGEELIAALWQIDQLADATVTYASLERNADRHQGKAVVFSGEVLEIQDIPDSHGSFIRLAVGGDYEHAMAIFALAPPADDIVRGRSVRAYGTLGGTYSYTSQAGWQITIPRLNAVAVVRTSVPRRAPRTGT